MAKSSCIHLIEIRCEKQITLCMIIRLQREESINVVFGQFQIALITTGNIIEI